MRENVFVRPDWLNVRQNLVPGLTYDRLIEKNYLQACKRDLIWLIWSSGLSAGLEFQWPQVQVLLWPAAGFVPGYRLWFKSSLALVRNPLLFLLSVGVLYLLSCLFYCGPEKPQRGVVKWSKLAYIKHARCKRAFQIREMKHCCNNSWSQCHSALRQRFRETLHHLTVSSV